MKLAALRSAVLSLLVTLTLHAQSTWTLRHQGPAPGDFLWSVTDGNFGAVAVGDGGKILHSLDGHTWVQRNSGTTLWIVAVTYGNGRYVAVGDDGMILTSTNGIAWTRVGVTGTTARLNNVVFADDKVVAVGEGGAVVVSLDGGQTWRAATSNAGTVWLRGLAFGGGRWIATGQNGTIIASSDGITWARVSSATTQDLESVVFVESYSYNYSYGTSTYRHFLAVGGNGTAQFCMLNEYQPTNGALSRSYGSYATSKPATSARLRSLTVGNKVFVTSGEDGTVYAAQSAHGPWRRLSIDTTKNLVGGGFVRGTLMLVGESRSIFQSEPIYISRLGNVATRGVVGDTAGAMIGGTVIEGPTPKQVLIRGIGPGLRPFGVINAAPNLSLEVYDSSGRLRAANTRWGAELNADAIATAAASVGAFALARDSNDCALLLTLNPGAYTFQLRATGGLGGNGLVEIYDMDSFGGNTSRAINLATRGLVGAGDDILIAGLVVQGQSSRTLLVRGVGPGLVPFGVPSTLLDPVIKIVAENGTVLATNDNWSESTLTNGRVVDADEVQTAAAASGAFPLAVNSRDAALLITLVPGNYTVQVSGAAGGLGIALVEAYDVPTN